MEDLPEKIDVGDEIDLDEYVGADDYDVQVEGDAIVAEGHLLKAKTWGSAIVIVKRGGRQASETVTVRSDHMTQINAFLSDLSNNYMVQLIHHVVSTSYGASSSVETTVTDTLDSQVYHTANYSLIENSLGISGKILLKNGHGYNYSFPDASLAAKDLTVQSGMIDYPNYYESAPFEFVKEDYYRDLQNKSRDVIIDGKAANYLPLFLLGYATGSYFPGAGVTFYALHYKKADDGAETLTFHPYKGNDQEGDGSFPYDIIVSKKNEVKIAALEDYIASGKEPSPIARDYMLEAFHSLTASNNYTLTYQGRYVDAVNGGYVNDDSIIRSLAKIGFGIPAKIVAKSNATSYCSEVESGYLATSRGSVLDLTGEIRAYAPIKSSGTSRLAELYVNHKNDAYTFTGGRYLTDVNQVSNLPFAASSITDALIDGVNVYAAGKYADTYYYDFDGLADDGAFLAQLINLIPQYGDPLLAYWQSYGSEEAAWYKFLDYSYTELAYDTKKKEIEIVIPTIGFWMDQAQTMAYRYVMDFKFTDIDNTAVPNTYLTCVDWTQVE